MLNERLTAARNVANELLPAESEVEQAIVHTSRLAIAIVEGRRQAKLPITIGQEALGNVASATARLVEARGELGAAHVALRDVQAEIGLNAVSVGDLWECPERKTGQLTNLRPIKAA